MLWPVLTCNTDLMEKRGIRFRNEFLAFHQHAITDVPREVDYESCTIQTFTPI